MAAKDPNGGKYGASIPLLEAIKGDQIDLAKLLIGHRARSNDVGTSHSPLPSAIEGKNHALVQLLIGSGANMTITFDIYHGDCDWHSNVIGLFRWAERCGAKSLVPLLRASGASY